MLLVGESFAQRVTAFDVADDGNLSGRRVWASFGPSPSADTDFATFSRSMAPERRSVDLQGRLLAVRVDAPRAGWP